MKSQESASPKPGIMKGNQQLLTEGQTNFVIDLIRYTIGIAELHPEGHYEIFLNDRLVGSTTRILETKDNKSVTE